MKGIGQYPVGTGEGQDKSENNLGGVGAINTRL